MSTHKSRLQGHYQDAIKELQLATNIAMHASDDPQDVHDTLEGRIDHMWDHVAGASDALRALWAELEHEARVQAALARIDRDNEAKGVERVARVTAHLAMMTPTERRAESDRLNADLFGDQ